MHVPPVPVRDILIFWFLSSSLSGALYCLFHALVGNLTLALVVSTCIKLSILASNSSLSSLLMVYIYRSQIVEFESVPECFESVP